MAEEPEMDISEIEIEAGGFGEGVLSQDALDALIAETAQKDNIKDNIMVDLPSFDLPSAGTNYGGPEPVGMGRVRDIPLEVTVELGRTRLLIRDILDLSSGSIIELDKIAGEPVDLFANGMLVARGEVIVIDDNFGVRVTEIITAAERSATEKDIHAFAT